MSSLVAYDDSEPEDDCQHPSEEGHPASDLSRASESRQCTSSEVTQSLHRPTAAEAGRSTLEHHGLNSEGNWTSLQPHPQSRGEHFRVAPPPFSLAVTQGKIPPMQTPPHALQRFSDKLNPAKRLCTVPSGVRPYIPKRQRLATSAETVEPKSQVEYDPGCQTKGSHVLSEVSERVKPYLDNRPGTAGIPRRLLMSLGGHQGPVNTVQWCPVPQHSHLLLSASMDKTFKVWDGAESGRCLRAHTCHSGAVRDACWTPCGRRLLTGSFDNLAVITDVETGQGLATFDNQFRVMCVAVHPGSPEVFLCGGYSAAVKAWDSRCSKMVSVYKAGIQQTLDILFLRGGADFITSSDCVSRDSADRTLIAWDFQTTARISNQIYHERYTCPSLALHPLEEFFVAQTNGNYMAVFSSQRPYRMNKRRRYEGHKVEGYAVQCHFSTDGTILASGSSTGSAHFYDYHAARPLHSLQAHAEACLCVAQHPVLPATAATCDWAGEIKIWH